MPTFWRIQTLFWFVTIVFLSRDLQHNLYFLKNRFSFHNIEHLTVAMGLENIKKFIFIFWKLTIL